MIERKSLYFLRPYQAALQCEELALPAPHQVVVKTTLSAISAGTEMLFYRGQVPAGMSVDATIQGMDESVQYPLAYGYCNVGRVVALGSSVDARWLGRRVFAFHPHTSDFLAEPASLLPIPDSLSDEQALFLPNMETAINFVMDARPLVGERILIFGLGVVGLLTLHLLKQFPLSTLSAIDGYANRRALATKWGANAVYPPSETDDLARFDPDLIFELSSNPAALARAVDLAGYGTRILVGSWYGDKVAPLPLGGNFHRNRIQLISSQVSTVDGQFSNRWTKSRRLQTVWEQLHKLPTDDLITHRLPITAASDAYAMLDKQPEQTLQILFTY